jgi:hypothetical protein
VDSSQSHRYLRYHWFVVFVPSNKISPFPFFIISPGFSLPIYVDFDLHSTATPHQVLTNWEDVLSNAAQIDTSFTCIVLEYDLWQQSVKIATRYILNAFVTKIRIEPVVWGLHEPMTDASI